MAGDDFYHRIGDRPSHEEWESRQREEIVKRWRRLSADLEGLIKDGVLDREKPLGAAIDALNTLGPTDVR